MSRDSQAVVVALSVDSLAQVVAPVAQVLSLNEQVVTQIRERRADLNHDRHCSRDGCPRRTVRVVVELAQLCGAPRNRVYAELGIMRSRFGGARARL